MKRELGREREGGGKKEIEWGKRDRGKERDSGRAEVSRVNNDLTLWLWYATQIHKLY